MNSNVSWNCGVEGPTTGPQIEALRDRQIRNALALTILSIGTPLLLMGDEARRTQLGNNNAYCQNNEVSWFDWTLCQTNAGLLRFVSILIHMRRHIGSSFNGHNLSLQGLLDHARVEWHGVTLNNPDLSDQSHSLAATVYLSTGPTLHLMLNAYWDSLRFAIPPVSSTASPWYRIIDTSLPSPQDIADSNHERIATKEYFVASRSVVLLGNDDVKQS